MGVAAVTQSGHTLLAYREAERFALCSTFKWVLAAVLLARVDEGNLDLESPIHFGPSDLLEYAPVTRARVGEGAMTLDALASAMVTTSDNTAANLLLALVGGPEALTKNVRSWGDSVTRLDRIEPELNGNLPQDVRDTTTPMAMSGLLQRVFSTATLSKASRARLLRWMHESTTGVTRLRAGFPSTWEAGDKSGTGGNGAVCDVAVAHPARNETIFVSAYLSGSTASLEHLAETLRKVGVLVAEVAALGNSLAV